jgi:hypothetical protein
MAAPGKSGDVVVSDVVRPLARGKDCLFADWAEAGFS